VAFPAGVCFKRRQKEDSDSGGGTNDARQNGRPIKRPAFKDIEEEGPEKVARREKSFEDHPPEIARRNARGELHACPVIKDERLEKRGSKNWGGGEAELPLH